MTSDFHGRVALVTGASGGIGRAVCRQLAGRGARVAVHYGGRREAAEETLAALPGDGHQLVQADLMEPQGVRAMVETVTGGLGRLDLLVNNAGIFERHPLAGVSYEEWQDHWRRTLGVNLVGAANACYCAARWMIAHGGGRIVNVSSRGAFRGEPESPAYGASKAGMNALSQSLAQALAPHGVFVYAIAPGFVDTPMATEYLAGPGGEGIRRQSPLARVATPEEVAYWVVCCAAPGAEFATGAIVDVNGASYLRS